MQEWWRGWWRAQTEDEPPHVDMPEDFGWHDESGVRRWGIHYFLSGYNPGHLPRAGGVMALTEAEWSDLQLLMVGVAWARSESFERHKERQNSENAMMRDYTQ